MPSAGSLRRPSVRAARRWRDHAMRPVFLKKAAAERNQPDAAAPAPARAGRATATAKPGTGCHETQQPFANCLPARSAFEVGPDAKAPVPANSVGVDELEGGH